MFNWISNLFVNIALDAAVYSAGLASSNGLHQLSEPAGLQKIATEIKNHKKSKRNI